MLNALIGEKLAIVSPKVQTTRHRIKGILTTDAYQIIFSDTPGIIDPKYKLHEKMMSAVKGSLEDADVAILLADINGDLQAEADLFASLKLKAKAIVVLNKIDRASPAKVDEALAFFAGKPFAAKVMTISALQQAGVNELLEAIVELLPEGQPFFEGDDISDMPTKFFVGELIREKIFEFYQEELPYQSTVLVQEFSEKSTLIKIRAEIIVQRETQKAIILGEKGKMIKKLGTEARLSIEQFLGQKVFLELFVKVRDKWRDNETHLREYGYK